MADHLSLRSALLSALGGTLAVYREGEHLFDIPVPPGRVRFADYVDLIPADCEVDAVGLVVLDPPSAVGIQAYGPTSHDTGANPDYRPTSASRLERELRVTLNKMQQATARVEAREKHLAKVERVPVSPAPVSEPLVEPIEPKVEEIAKQ